MTNLIETEDLTYAYSPRQERASLRHVDIGISEGKRTVILGANGAGKSTLFYHFNGVFKPKEGTVRYRGEPLDYSKDALRRLRSEISVVVQNPDEQIFSSTVEEDIAFGPMNMGMERDEVERRIQDSLFKVGMSEFRHRPSTQLSYGQRKRVSLAGALAMDPAVLILDEPTAGLDPQMSQEVMELVDQLCVSGTTVIISTHDVDFAYSWADEMHVLMNGSLVYSGCPEIFFTDPEQVALTGLTCPHTFSVNQAVEGIRGEPEAPHPRTNSQLLAKMAPEGLRPGRVRLVDVSDGCVPSLEEGIRTGVYGFHARRAFSEAGVEADYRFNAVEMCMLDCVSGRDSVLYCDAELRETVTHRIMSLERFGVRPEVLRCRIT